VIRPSRAEAERAWAAWTSVHCPIEGEERLDAAGTVEEVADALRALSDVGFAHPVMIFRTPFDHETIERLPQLRAVLAS
jgi:alkanesulfonate monooxygenase SsuD/methylene tetrahydromethanopterin reductase-like flavin-dependent oxidoreductase (luciferase family)